MSNAEKTAVPISERSELPEASNPPVHVRGVDARISRHPVDIEKDIRRKKDWSKVVGEQPQSTRVRKPVTKFGAKAPKPKPPVLEEQSEDDDGSQSENSEEYASPESSPDNTGLEDCHGTSSKYTQRARGHN